MGGLVIEGWVVLSYRDGWSCHRGMGGLVIEGWVVCYPFDNVFFFSKVLKISKLSYSLHGHSRSSNYLPNDLDTPRGDLVLYTDLSRSNTNRRTVLKYHDSSPGVNNPL